MDTRDTIEHYFIQMEYPFESIEPDMWIIHDTANVVVTYEPPLVVFRIKLMEIPKDRREDFFKLLLELNATNMIHGAYGIEGDNVVLIDTLQSEYLDFNEFQASLDALLMASTQDYQKLNAFRA
jgi:CesT_Tir_1